jgi:2-polyprenyl-6-methoxyphenol hydroxylase-like FAD-dependent oxidoreductase
MQTNVAMMAGLHMLQRVYGSQSQPVVGVRNMGMALINQLGPVRNQLMQIAMGNAGK